MGDGGLGCCRSPTATPMDDALTIDEAVEVIYDIICGQRALGTFCAAEELGILATVSAIVTNDMLSEAEEDGEEEEGEGEEPEPEACPTIRTAI